MNCQSFKDTYDCVDRALYGIECDRLSKYILPNGKCWNEIEGNKICKTGGGWELKEDTICVNSEVGNRYSSEGWAKIIDNTIIDVNESEQIAEIVKTHANGKNWECNTDNGEVNSYTKCHSDKGTDTYLGELI